jgi:hypothetical protein
MNLYHYIGELLYGHDCVVVPGLGGFVTNYTPAKIHPVLHTFSPPSKSILFNVRLQSNDGVLASYVAEKEKISYDEAMGLIRQFVDIIRAAIENAHTVEILKVGVLYRDNEANLQFEPSKEVNYLLSSFGFTEFVSPAIQRNTFRVHQEKRLYDRPVTRRDRHVPVALKRAVWIGIPVVALLVAGFLSINTIKQVYTQYSGLLPELSNKTKEAKENAPMNYKADKVFMGLFDKRLMGEIPEKNSQPYPFRITMKQEVNPGNETEIPSVSSPANGHKYFIVGGCFRIKENAENFVHGLKQKGFEGAGFFLPEKKTLYRAYYSSFEDKASAERELQRIHEVELPDAWLLEL